MTLDEFAAIYEQLKLHSFAFFLFKRIFIDKTDRLPTNLMDRGKELPILMDLNLISYYRGHWDDHEHYKPANLTEFGRECGQYFASERIFEKFDSISIESLPDFEKSFEQQFLIHEEYSIDFTRDEILSQFDFPIGRPRVQQGVSLNITGFKRLPIERRDLYAFRIQIICKRCQNTFEFIQQIEYKEDSFQPFNFFKVCPQCGLKLLCNSYFSQYQMYIDEET